MSGASLQASPASRRVPLELTSAYNVRRRPLMKLSRWIVTCAATFLIATASGAFAQAPV